MDFKKIQINKSSYIRLYDDDTFEVHCSAQGPLGANVYYFSHFIHGFPFFKSLFETTPP